MPAKDATPKPTLAQMMVYAWFRKSFNGLRNEMAPLVKPLELAGQTKFEIARELLDAVTWAVEQIRRELNEKEPATQEQE